MLTLATCRKDRNGRVAIAITYVLAKTLDGFKEISQFKEELSQHTVKLKLSSKREVDV